MWTARVETDYRYATRIVLQVRDKAIRSVIGFDLWYPCREAVGQSWGLLPRSADAR